MLTLLMLLAKRSPKDLSVNKAVELWFRAAARPQNVKGQSLPATRQSALNSWAISIAMLRICGPRTGGSADKLRRK